MLSVKEKDAARCDSRPSHARREHGASPLLWWSTHCTFLGVFWPEGPAEPFLLSFTDLSLLAMILTGVRDPLVPAALDMEKRNKGKGDKIADSPMLPSARYIYYRRNLFKKKREIEIYHAPISVPVNIKEIRDLPCKLHARPIFGSRKMDMGYPQADRRVLVKDTVRWRLMAAVGQLTNLFPLTSTGWSPRHERPGPWPDKLGTCPTHDLSDSGDLCASSPSNLKKITLKLRNVLVARRRLCTTL